MSDKTKENLLILALASIGVVLLIVLLNFIAFILVLQGY